NYGWGMVTNILGEGRKLCLIIKFGKSKKIIDPKTAPMEKMESWQVGDQVMHKNYGLGMVTNIVGEEKKPTLGIKFGKSKKIIDPQTAPMEKLK
ncbi:MAG: hypothetical protein AB4080_16015, partial [Trichodesmium sp.]